VKVVIFPLQAPKKLPVFGSVRHWWIHHSKKGLLHSKPHSQLGKRCQGILLLLHHYLPSKFFFQGQVWSNGNYYYLSSAISHCSNWGCDSILWKVERNWFLLFLSLFFCSFCRHKGQHSLCHHKSCQGRAYFQQLRTFHFLSNLRGYSTTLPLWKSFHRTDRVLVFDSHGCRQALGGGCKIHVPPTEVAVIEHIRYG